MKSCLKNLIAGILLSALCVTPMVAYAASDADVEVIDSYSGAVNYVEIDGNIGTPDEKWGAELNSRVTSAVAWRVTLLTLNDKTILEELGDLSDAEREAKLKSLDTRKHFNSIGSPIFLVDESKFPNLPIQYGNDPAVYKLSDDSIVFGGHTVNHRNWMTFYGADTGTSSNPNFIYLNGDSPVINGGVLYSSVASSPYVQDRLNTAGKTYASIFQQLCNDVRVTGSQVVVDGGLQNHIHDIATNKEFIAELKTVLANKSLYSDVDAMMLYFEPMINVILYVDHKDPQNPLMVPMVLAPSDFLYLTTYDNRSTTEPYPMYGIQDQVNSFMKSINSANSIKGRTAGGISWYGNVNSIYKDAVSYMYNSDGANGGGGAVAELVLTKEIERKDNMWESPPAIRLYDAEGDLSSADYQTSVTISDSVWKQIVEVLEYAKGLRNTKPSNALMSRIGDAYFKDFILDDWKLAKHAKDKDGNYTPDYIEAYDKLMQRIYEICDILSLKLNLNGNVNFTVSASSPSATLKFSVNGHDYYEYGGVGSIGHSTTNCSLYTKTYAANTGKIFSTSDYHEISTREFSYSDLLQHPYAYAAVRGTVTTSGGAIARPVVRIFDENSLSSGSDVLTVDDDLYSAVNDMLMYATNADGASRPASLNKVDQGVTCTYYVGDTGTTRTLNLWDMMDLLHKDAEYMWKYNFSKYSWEGSGNALDSILSNIFNFDLVDGRWDEVLEDVKRINQRHTEPNPANHLTKYNYGDDGWARDGDYGNFDYMYYGNKDGSNIPEISLCLDAALCGSHDHRGFDPGCERSWSAYDYVNDAYNYLIGGGSYDPYDYHLHYVDDNQWFRTCVYVEAVKGYRKNLNSFVNCMWENLDKVVVISNTNNYNDSADLRFSSEPGSLSYNKDNFKHWLHNKSKIYESTYCDFLYKNTNERVGSDSTLSTVVASHVRAYAYGNVGSVLSAGELRSKITSNSTCGQITLGDLFRNPYSYGISYNTLATSTTPTIVGRPWVWTQEVEVGIPSASTFTDDPTKTEFIAPIVNTNSFPAPDVVSGPAIKGTPWITRSRIIKGHPKMSVEITRTAKKTISKLWTPDAVKTKLTNMTIGGTPYEDYRNTVTAGPFNYDKSIMVTKLNETVQFVSAKDLDPADKPLTYNPVQENVSIMAKDQHDNVYRVADTELSIAGIPNIGNVDLNKIKQYSGPSEKWTPSVGFKAVKELAMTKWKFRGAIPMKFSYTESIPPGMPSSVVPLFLAQAGKSWTGLSALTTSDNVWVYSPNDDKVETQTALSYRYAGTATISGSWSTERADLDATVNSGAPVMAAGQVIPITIYSSNPSDTGGTNKGIFSVELYSIVTIDKYVDEFSAGSQIMKYSDFENLVNTIKNSISTKSTLQIASTLAGGVTDASKTNLTTDASIAPAINISSAPSPSITTKIETRHCPGRFGNQTYTSGVVTIPGTTELDESESLYTQLQTKLFNGLGRESWAAEDFEGFFVAKAVITISFGNPKYALTVDVAESDGMTDFNQRYIDNKTSIDSAWKTTFGTAVKNSTNMHAIMPYLDLTACTDPVSFNGTTTTVAGIFGNYVCGAITNVNVRGSIYDKGYLSY